MIGLLATLLGGWCAAACAEPGGDAHHGAVTGRAVHSLATAEGEWERLLGAGLAVESPPTHGFALEATVGKQSGAFAEETPLELVVERLFPVGRHLEPFVGAGPALVVRSPHDAAVHEVRAGAVGVVGTHLWLGPAWGLLLETDVVATHHAAWSYASETLTGVVLRLP